MARARACDEFSRAAQQENTARHASFVSSCRTGCGMFARYASRVSRTLLADCFSILLRSTHSS